MSLAEAGKNELLGGISDLPYLPDDSKVIAYYGGVTNGMVLRIAYDNNLRLFVLRVFCGEIRWSSPDCFAGFAAFPEETAATFADCISKVNMLNERIVQELTAMHGSHFKSGVVVLESRNHGQIYRSHPTHMHEDAESSGRWRATYKGYEEQPEMTDSELLKRNAGFYFMMFPWWSKAVLCVVCLPVFVVNRIVKLFR